MKAIIYPGCLVVLLLITMTSCDKDDPVIPNEEELITTLTYTLTSSQGTVVLSFQDLDGDGGNAPIISTESLSPNTTYTGTLELLNESETPAEDITEEVAEEDAEHQFFFDVGQANLTVNYNDADVDGNPIGIATTLVTGDASTGTLTITLLHEPKKDAAGVSDGDITNAEGEADIEVTFEIVIE